MANSSTNIDGVVQSQSSKEVTINAYFDAASPATLYGRRQSACSGLTWGYYGGNVTKSDASLAQIANGTLTLTASTTNYVVAQKTDGVVSVATTTTNWNSADYWRLYSIVTGTATVTSYTDYREIGKMTGGGGGTGSSITAKDEGSNLTTALASIDFVGAGVTATTSGNDVTVTISGSAGGREMLTANRTYYVRTDGSDSNNGLANTSGGAFLTVQKSIDTVCNGLDIQNHNVTIQLGDGTYTSGMELKDIVGNGVVTIQGNSGTPSNVVISTTSGNCVNAGQYARGYWAIKDFKVQTTTGGRGVVLQRGAFLTYGNIVFGSCVGSHIDVSAGSTLICTSNYSISGGAPYHFYACFGGYIACSGRTITITGTPAFSTAFASASQTGSIQSALCTFSGSATGVRYSATLNGVIDTTAGGASYFPGGTSGTTATGGQYV